MHTGLTFTTGAEEIGEYIEFVKMIEGVRESNDRLGTMLSTS